MTFSSKGYLERKTGAHGVGRFQYLQTLVTEFQDTHKEGIVIPLTIEGMGELFRYARIHGIK